MNDRDAGCSWKTVRYSCIRRLLATQVPT